MREVGEGEAEGGAAKAAVGASTSGLRGDGVEGRALRQRRETGMVSYECARGKKWE